MPSPIPRALTTRNSSTRVWLVACLLLLSSTTPVVALATGTGTDAQIDEVRYSGSGNVSTAESELYLWQASVHEFTATISTTSEIEAELCLVTVPDGTETEREVACEPTTIPANTTEPRAVSISSWPSELNGSQEASIVLRSTNGSDVIARESLSLTVIRKDGDLDGDGLTNEREASLGTGLRTSDTDGDGLSDGVEVNTHETSPTKTDTDDDGVSDYEEVHTHGTDPTQPDSDEDGLSDAQEAELGTNPTKADTDGDGVDDGAEVNVHETDPTAPDTDGDGLDDGAEITEHETNPLQSDTDGDGLSDNLEVNTYETDPTKVDTDGDGLEDGTEVNEFQTDPTTADTDDDGLTDGQEVNTHETDPTNPDTDGDGLQDGAEINQYGTNPNEVDTDNDGQSDYAEVKDQELVSLRPSTIGIVGAVALLVGGVVLYQSDGLSWTPVQRVRAVVSAEGNGTVNAGSADDGPADEPPAEKGDVPFEFLSNEEQVLRVLDNHEGRMRQSEIVEETGWSKSKVSRVLTEMEADEQIVKIDVGRANVVSRPDDLPAGAESPFDG